MPNQPNKYHSMPKTGKSSRKQEKVAATVLMIPFVEFETHDHGEKIDKKENRINDQTKSGKRKGALLLTDTHGLVLASGSKEDDPWFKFTFEPEKEVTPI